MTSPMPAFDVPQCGIGFPEDELDELAEAMQWMRFAPVRRPTPDQINRPQCPDEDALDLTVLSFSER